MKCREEIIAAGTARTPFGRFGGSLREVDIYDLGAYAMKGTLDKTGIDPKQVDEVWWGCGDTTNCKDPYTPVVARQTLIKAGLLPSTPSVTLDKACVSGMSAANYGIGRILLGEADVVLAGGATSFSTVPYLARDLRWQGKKTGGFQLEDPLFPLGYKDYAPVAVDSGRVAELFGVTRQEQDQLAYESHKNYGAAYEEGFYSDQIIPMEVTFKKGKKTETIQLMQDEQYRETIQVETLAKLKTIFGNPTITAGNSPGLNDGAASQLIMTKATADKLGINPMYTIMGMTSIATDADLLPVAPALAIKKCLEEQELTIEDVDVLEINEAFACVPLVSCKLLACKDFMTADYHKVSQNIRNFPLDSFDSDAYKRLLSKLNLNGGAIAIGHANTASGARIMFQAADNLKKQGGKIGVAAICGGLTQGDACVLRV